MWRQTECNCCQTMVFVQHEDDALCDRCEELNQLKIKVERYEKALKTIVEMETVDKRFGQNICTATGIIAQQILKG